MKGSEAVGVNERLNLFVFIENHADFPNYIFVIMFYLFTLNSVSDPGQFFQFP